MFQGKVAPRIFFPLIVGATVWSAVSLAQFGNEPMTGVSHPVLPFASALDLVLPAHEAPTTSTNSPMPVSPEGPAKSALQQDVARTFHLVNLGHVLQLKMPNGEEVLSIPARIDARIHGRRRAMQGAWQSKENDTFVASLISPMAESELSVQLDPNTAEIKVDVDVTYRRDLRVDFERWRWRVHNADAEILDRGYRRTSIPAGGVFVDHLTPHVGQWSQDDEPAFSLLGNDTFEGVWYHNDEIMFELDHLHNHPHTIVDDCYEAYDGERPWFDVSQSQRFLNEHVSHHITFVAGKAYPPLLGRWPNGRRAAIAFVDHADNGQLPQLRAIAYGSSERTGPAKRPKKKSGFLGHGIPITKTVFDSRQQLGNEDYRSLLRSFRDQGSEIAPHSITGGYDKAEGIEKSLQGAFAEFKPRTWVDHQPDTNCEALNNWGGEPNSPDSMVDMLHNMGIRYFWEAPDPVGWKGLNLFRPDRPLDRGIGFYPAMSLRSADFTPWLFVSTWLFLPVDLIAERFSPQHLDKFESEAGLLIGHTYLSKIDADRKGERSVLRRDRAGNLYLHPKYDQMLGELARRQDSGSLWFPTISQLGDWLVRRANIRITPNAASFATLTERNGSSFGGTVTDVGLIPWPGSTIEWRDDAKGAQTQAVLHVSPFLYDPQVRVRSAGPEARYANAAVGHD